MIALGLAAVAIAAEPPSTPADAVTALIERVDAWSPLGGAAPWDALDRLLASPPPADLRGRRDAACRRLFDLLSASASDPGGEEAPGAHAPAGAPAGLRMEGLAHLVDLGLDLWLATGDERLRARSRAPLAALVSACRGGTVAGPVPQALISGALARASLFVDDPALLDLARSIAAGIAPGGGLDGRAEVAMVAGLLRLAQAGGGSAWLARAVSIQDDLDARWWRPAEQGYGDDAVDAAAVHGLAVLVTLLDDDAWRERLQALSAGLGKRSAPPAPGNALARLAMAEAAGARGHLIIVVPPASAGARLLLAAAQAGPPDRLAVLMQDGAPELARLQERFPAVVPMPAVQAQATAYLCFPQRCLPAVTSAAALAGQIAGELGHR